MILIRCNWFPWVTLRNVYWYTAWGWWMLGCDN